MLKANGDNTRQPIFNARSKAAAVILSCASVIVACGNGGQAEAWHHSGRVVDQAPLPVAGLDPRYKNRMGFFSDGDVEVDTAPKDSNKDKGYLILSCTKDGVLNAEAYIKPTDTSTYYVHTSVQFTEPPESTACEDGHLTKAEVRSLFTELKTA